MCNSERSTIVLKSQEASTLAIKWTEKMMRCAHSMLDDDDPLSHADASYMNEMFLLIANQFPGTNYTPVCSLSPCVPGRPTTIPRILPLLENSSTSVKAAHFATICMNGNNRFSENSADAVRICLRFLKVSFSSFDRQGSEDIYSFDYGTPWSVVHTLISYARNCPTNKGIELIQILMPSLLDDMSMCIDIHDDSYWTSTPAYQRWLELCWGTRVQGVCRYDLTKEHLQRKTCILEHVFKGWLTAPVRKGGAELPSDVARFLLADIAGEPF